MRYTIAKPRTITLTSFLMLTSLLASAQQSPATFKRVCYIAAWRAGIDRIDPNLCTHLIYAFGQITETTLELTYQSEHEVADNGPFEQLAKLKSLNSNLRTLISVGGANAQNDRFERLTSATQWAITSFAKQVIAFLRQHKFDGLDVDWEYPTDNTTLSDLLKTLRSEFDTELLTEGRERLLLSVALASERTQLQKSYDLLAVSNHSDFLNVMTYDYHGGWNKIAGLHSPLLPRTGAYKFHPDLHSAWTIQELINQGVDKGKILMGIPTYGRAYKLKDKTQHNVGAPINGNAGPGLLYPKITNGTWWYPEICMFLRNGGARYKFDDKQKSAFAYSLDRWVGFDDVRSVIGKTKWAMSMGLGGMMVWAVNYDDYSGRYCDQGKYPLTQAINSTVYGAETDMVLALPLPTYQANQTSRSIDTNGTYRRVCYYNSFASRLGNAGARLYIDQVGADASLCTHIHYAYAYIDDVAASIIPYYNHDEVGPRTEKSNYASLNDLKTSNLKLMTILSIGGGQAGSYAFNYILNMGLMDDFARNAAAYLRRWGFDGLDIVWQWPQVTHFTAFAKGLHDAFSLEAAMNNRSKLLLTAAVSPNATQIDHSYNVTEISNYFDYVNVLTDKYVVSNEKTMLKSPLYPPANEPTDLYNQRASIAEWLRRRAPPSMLNLGLAGYGVSHTLRSPSSNKIGASTMLDPPVSKYTGESGTMPYYEICEIVKRVQTETEVPRQVCTYTYDNYTWLTYDNPINIAEKMDWLMENQLGGFWFWSLESDDFSGQFCDCGRFPLLTTAKEALTWSGLSPYRPRETVCSTQIAWVTRTEGPVTRSTTTYRPVRTTSNSKSLNAGLVTIFLCTCIFSLWRVTL